MRPTVGTPSPVNFCGQGRAVRLLVLLLAFALFRPAAFGHVGSLNVIFEGFAGNIPVRVIIRPPGVVPGLADINVRVLTNGNAVQKVSVLPVHWRAGLDGAPPPDIAEPVDGEPGLYHAGLWLMASGAYSVHVNVETRDGSGRVIVPVNSLATTRLSLSPVLTAILVALGLLLFALAISVAGAAVRDSVLPPGETASPRRRWIGRVATGIAALLVWASLSGGKSWWDSVDRDYRNNRMFKPVPVTARASWEGSRQILRLQVDEKKAGNNWAPLVPDHGKWMHLFLISDSLGGAFAHLHPMKRRSGEFVGALPSLPAGHYKVFADVTHESGFAQTLVTAVELSARSSGAGADDAQPSSDVAGGTEHVLEPDPDDSIFPSATDVAVDKLIADDRRRSVGDGLTIGWDAPAPSSAPLRVGEPTSLQFSVRDRSGNPASLQAYMGMLSHLILMREDGAVFTHLHPAGSISMASQQVFQLRAGDKPPKRITPAMMEELCQPPTPAMLQQPITFPYEFPKAGRYRVWVQVKVDGRVHTAEFGAEVSERRP